MPKIAPWTQADLDLLKRLVESGEMSFGQMTREFPGRSRNALIGKALRSGWKQPAAPSVPKAKREYVRARHETVPTAESVRIVAEDEETITLVMDESDGPLYEDADGNPVREEDVCRSPVTVRRLMLDELRSDTCRWPIGDRAPFLFCGDRACAGGGPYCEHHHEMAYQKRRPNFDKPHHPRKKTGLSFRYSYGVKST